MLHFVISDLEFIETTLVFVRTQGCYFFVDDDDDIYFPLSCFLSCHCLVEHSVIINTSLGIVDWMISNVLIKYIYDIISKGTWWLLTMDLIQSGLALLYREIWSLIKSVVN